MKRKESPRVRETKTLLRSALLRLLEKKPIARISVTALCDEAGVNRTTFYKYYDSVEDLYDTVMEDHLTELGEAYKKSLEETHDLRAATITALRFLENNLSESRILMTSTPSTKYIGKTERPISTDTFEEFAKQYNIPKNKLQAVLKFFSTGTFQLVRDWLFEDDRISAEEETDLIFFALKSSCSIYEYITGRN